MYEYQVVLFMQDYKTHKLPISFNKMYKINYEGQANHPTKQTKLYHDACPQLLKSYPVLIFHI